ncbi:hypothetical protein OROHE_017905 [Orobanche hederae]
MKMVRYEYFWFEADDRSFEFELCRTLSSEEVLYPELDGPIVNKKPPRKERKKSTQTPEKIQIYPSAEAQRDMHLTTTHIMNGSIVNPYDMHCSEDATKGFSISLKRTATENPSNPCTKNLCKTAAEVRPYVPAPLATKIYYSQRNHLRRAISHMFFEESSRDVSNLEVLQAPRDDNCSHLAQTPDQILAARADCYIGKSGGLVPTMNTASHLPVNNALGSHYSSKSYSFAGESVILFCGIRGGEGEGGRVSSSPLSPSTTSTSTRLSKSMRLSKGHDGKQVIIFKPRRLLWKDGIFFLSYPFIVRINFINDNGINFISPLNASLP